MSLALGFDQTKQLRMRDEEADQLNFLAAFQGATGMVQSPKHHLYTDLLQRLRQHLPDLHTHLRQDRIKDPRRVNLYLDAVFASDPQIAQPQQSFGQQKGFFDPPSSSIQLA